MKLRRTSEGLIAQAEDGQWFALPGETDLVDFLALREEAPPAAEAAIATAADSVTPRVRPPPPVPPFPPPLIPPLLLLGSP